VVGSDAIHEIIEAVDETPHRRSGVEKLLFHLII